MLDRAPPGRARVRPRARDEPRRDRRRASSAARSRTGSSASAATTRRGSCSARSSRAARRSTRGRSDRRPRTRRAGRDLASGASASSSTSASGTCQALDTIVDPLLVPDLATMVWAPHGHAEAVDALRRLAQIVLIDSQDEPDVEARAGARRRPRRATPTSSTSPGCARRRGASASPPPSTRRRCGAELAEISGVTVRHREDSLAAGAAVLRLAVLAPGLAAGRARRTARGSAGPGTRAPRRQEVTLAPRAGRA